MQLKKLIQSLPLTRLLVYLMALGCTPIFFAGAYYSSKKKEWKEVLNEVVHVQELAANTARKQYLNMVVRANYAEADPLYLENHLESLSFLKREKETLEHLIKSPTFTGNEAAEKRYLSLSSNANRLEWMQGSLQAIEGVQQSTCHLAHPVEVDFHDIKEILTRIEGSRKAKPQLIITDFKLNRKAHQSGNEVFELNMKLIKREFP